jgi:hypothetical protein
MKLPRDIDAATLKQMLLFIGKRRSLTRDIAMIDLEPEFLGA